MRQRARPAAAISRVEVAAYTVPTDGPEADGTLAWDATTLVVVRLHAGGANGLGYTYADTATATLIRDTLAPLLEGADALATAARRREMAVALRNLGRCGIGAMALSAADVALWDLKARLLGAPLAVLLGAARAAVPVYGSGGFTNQVERQLRAQIEHWLALGIERAKLKIGRDESADRTRVGIARAALGPHRELFVDANGAYTRKSALGTAQWLADHGVSWFEEPVSSDDLAGLRLLRDRAPPGMAIAAGEYGWALPCFRRMLAAQAVDVLQADATRCGGISGFLGASALCEAYGLPLSSHCAPALHAPLGCAAAPVVHLEYFHDHARIEQMLFDGAAQPVDGMLHADLSRPGLGLDLREQDAACYRQ